MLVKLLVTVGLVAALCGCVEQKPKLLIVLADKPAMCATKDGGSVFIHECWGKVEGLDK